MFHKYLCHSWQSYIIQERLKKKDLGAVPVNCSWFYNSNNQHVRGPVHIWRLRWAQSAATVTGCLKYDCVVERMIGLLFVSWVQVFITFLLSHFCTDYSKNHLHYVGVLSSTTPNSAWWGVSHMVTWSESEWVRTVLPQMKWRRLPPAVFYVPLRSVFLRLQKMWGCPPGVKEGAK